MSKREELVVRSANAGMAEVYRFWFQPLGWAFFTLDEATGCFSIQSDWGHYAHAWPSPGRGKGTLKSFIACAGCEYMATKFGYDREREFAREFDGEVTLQFVKKDIIEQRREGRIDQESARAAWDALEDWGLGSESEFYYTVPEEISAFYKGDLSELARYKPSPKFDFLVSTLLPFFQDVLNKELAGAGR